MKMMQTTYCKRSDNSCYHHQCIANWRAVVPRNQFAVAHCNAGADDSTVTCRWLLQTGRPYRGLGKIEKRCVATEAVDPELNFRLQLQQGYHAVLKKYWIWPKCTKSIKKVWKFQIQPFVYSNFVLYRRWWFCRHFLHCVPPIKYWKNEDKWWC